MSLSKRIVTSPAFQDAVATAGACYLRMVWNSTRCTVEPATIYETAERVRRLVSHPWLIDQLNAIEAKNSAIA